MDDFDVVVAGGGIAGSTAGAALARHGLRVLVCEAGLPSARRLAGELLHPPAVDNLDRLDLLAPLTAAGGVPVYGFAIVRDAADRGLLLSYGEVPNGRPFGFAIEHATMTRALLGAVALRPGITVWNDTRVTAVDDVGERPLVTLRRGTVEFQVQTCLVVSAEGRSSTLRDQAGIAATTSPPFRMIGWIVPRGRLPEPGYGHLFIGGKRPTLAYPVTRDAVRVMFEVGIDEGAAALEDRLGALPRAFREDVRRAMDAVPRQTTKFIALAPNRVVSGRVAVVGDAGGCVHPLTASGILFCTGDAMRLAEAVGPRFERGEGILEALAAYSDARRSPMRTRLTLGPALLEAFSSDTPELRLLRDGLFNYWERSARGRRTSMAVLSRQDTSVASVAKEYAAVCAHALARVRKGPLARHERLPAIVGLVRRNLALLRRSVSHG